MWHFADNNFPSFCLKTKQVQCFEYMLQGFDVSLILPTGFGKSVVFQLLPDFLPVKSYQNIVIVISPLTSIIEDQISALKLIEDSSLDNVDCLFEHEEDSESEQTSV